MTHKELLQSRNQAFLDLMYMARTEQDKLVKVTSQLKDMQSQLEKSQIQLDTMKFFS